LLAQTIIPSFPGALGYGGTTAGACSFVNTSGTSHVGGNVYIVTNLNDSGAGSFREGVGTSGNIVVFAVGGNIQALSPISCASNIDIEGQTAPGGIQIFGAECSFFGQSNIICRYMHFRDGTLDPNYPGSSATNSSTNAANLGDTTNVIMDHCTFEFAAYNNIDAGGNGAINSTIEYCIFADPILEQQFNFHLQGGPTTIIGCLMANSGGRNPLGKANLQFINNIVYNWGFAMTTGNSSGTFYWDVINNYFITGPNTTSDSDDYFQVDSGELAYATGNYEDTSENGTLQGSTANTVGGATVETSAWSPTTATLSSTSAQVAFYDVVSSAGPLPRDQVDSQVVSQTLSLGTEGRRFNTQSDTGLGNSGYGTITGGVALPDSDSSGMPDDWKAAEGLSLTNPAISGSTTSTGYTNLENYLAWKALPNAWVAKNTTAQPTSVTIDLSQYTNGFAAGSTFTISGTVNGTVAPMTGTQSSSNDFIVTFTPTLNASGLGGFSWSVNNGVTTMSSTCGVLISQSGPSQSVTWKGDSVNNYWDTSSTNWLTTSGSAVAFSAGDPVTFNDSGSTSPAVNIDTAVSPGEIQFNGVTSNYVLSGTGVIAGSGALVKNSTGILTCDNSVANTFSGGVDVNYGTLVVDQTLGTGQITLGNGTVVTVNSQFALGNNTLELTGSASISGINGTNIGAMIGGGTLDFTGNGTRFDLRGGISTFTGLMSLGNTSNSWRLYGATGSAGATFDLGTGTGSIYARNGNGTTYPLGALTGGTGTELNGPSDGIGMAWSVGALNTSTTFYGTMSGAGDSLTKVGTGTLTLTGNSASYTGTTTVSGGTLLVTGSLGNSTVTVNSGGTFISNISSLQSATVNGGGYFYPCATSTAGGAGTLTIANGFVVGTTGANPVNLYYVLSSSPTVTGSNTNITVTSGTLNVSGTVNFNISMTTGQLGPGTYTLIGGDAQMKVPGSPNPWLILNLGVPTGGITRQIFGLSRAGSGSTPGYIDLNVGNGNAGVLTWTGSNGATWDLDTTSDWSGASPDTFYDLDTVTFDDSDVGAGTVVLSGTLAPVFLYVNNNVNNYTFSGGGELAGNTEIVKSGTGSLTISDTGGNVFAGPIYLNAGTLYTDVYLGSGTIYLDGGTLSLSGGVFLGNPIVVETTSTIDSDNHSNWVANNPGATITSTSPVTLYIAIANGGAFTVGGNMDGFQGTFEIGASPGLVRLNGDGSAQALFDIGSSTATLANRNGGVTIDFGGLDGGSGTFLQGRQSGSGDTASTYVVGALNTNTAFAGTITNGGDESGLNFDKVGTGNWTLSGTSNWLGGILVEDGTLTITGSDNNGGLGFEAQSGAAFSLQGGTVTTETVQIDSGAIFTGTGTINGDFVNHGAATVNGGGALTINGGFENDGTMTVEGGSTLDVNLSANGGSNSFVNTGLLDIMDSPQTVLPSGYVNTGTILTSALVTVQSFSKSGNNFSVTIQTYTGHTYQLQESTDLNTWQNVGSAQVGTGSAIVLTDTNSVGQGLFYQVGVGP
jgi:autotransporter-associated beta strand protein